MHHIIINPLTINGTNTNHPIICTYTATYILEWTHKPRPRVHDCCKPTHMRIFEKSNRHTAPAILDLYFEVLNCEKQLLPIVEWWLLMNANYTIECVSEHSHVTPQNYNTSSHCVRIHSKINIYILYSFALGYIWARNIYIYIYLQPSRKLRYSDYKKKQ